MRPPRTRKLGAPVSINKQGSMSVPLSSSSLSMMIRDANQGSVVEFSISLLIGSTVGGIMVNNLLATVSTISRGVMVMGASYIHLRKA